MGGLVRAGKARTGQRLDLTVQQGRAVAGWSAVAASRSTSPGFDFLGLHVPLAVDSLFLASLLPSPFFVDFQGNLDPSGVARPALLIPAEPRAARPDHVPGQPDALPGSRAEGRPCGM